MYNFKYQYIYQSGSAPHNKYQNKTILTARFSFDEEVPRNQRAEVKKRLSLDNSMEGETLDRFMKTTLNYQPCYSDLFRGKEYFGKREVVKIIPFLWGLGFKLVSEADGQLPFEEMIHLKALKDFVLTGKFSPEVEKQLQEQQA